MAPPRPCKKPRAPKATAAAATDALISLPRDILDEILSRLELRDAARTSALSHAWRHRWESLPSIDIHISGQPPLWAVDSILLRCTGRVRSFQVTLDELSVRRLHDWLLVLSRRGVEDLDLRPQKYKFFSLQSTVFSCRRLTSLDLFACEIPPLPHDFEGFPDLKVLSLDHVKLQDNGEYQLEEIFETSPLLEKLILCEVCIAGDNFIEWEIRAPNLRQLSICSNMDYGWNYVEMPCLNSAVIDSWEYQGESDLANFLAGLVQATKRRILIDFAVNELLEAFPCTFHNLTSLKLLIHFRELPPIVSLFSLLGVHRILKN